MAHEEWRDIVGYEGYYQVSNLGRVRSVDRVIPRTNQADARLTGKILGFNPHGHNGYLCVKLSKDGQHKNMRVHRLVAEAFIPNPMEKPQIDHIDMNKHNNTADNLRWVSCKENMAYRHTEEESSRSPILCSNGKTYVSCADAAKDLGCNASNIYRVINGHRRAYRGLTFERSKDKENRQKARS